MDLPSYREVIVREHQWEIELPCDAKTFDMGYRHIKQEMGKEGVDLAFDDAFQVRVTEEGVIFVAKVMP